MSSRLQFQLESTEKGNMKARAATFQTLHNPVKTPCFMPVGTQGTVKAQTQEDLEAVGAQVLLANTYHLMNRPGIEVFKKMGGLHRLMTWKKSILTDSGGFQIFSLRNDRKITEEGAHFKNFRDGKKLFVSPESSIEMQMAIGSDIMMVLDECIDSTSPKEVAIEALHLTHRWAERSLNARGNSPQALFGIVQGACYEDLREMSAKQITSLPFDGFAIGGLAVGESKFERERITGFTTALLPENKPRYLMGVGTPIDLLEAVARGVDMFDCILPHSLGQYGVAFSFNGQISLRKSTYAFDSSPIDLQCECKVCRRFSKSYLHHLIRSDEIYGWHLIAFHNLHFYQKLCGEMRQAILENSFEEYYKKQQIRLVLSDKDTVKGAYSLYFSNPDQPEQGKIGIQYNSPYGSNAKSELMHSSTQNPYEEAIALYVRGSGCLEELQEKNICVWDVGLGCAYNSMALILSASEQAKQFNKPVELRIISFENNLDSLILALEHKNLFRHLSHEAPTKLLKEGKWEETIGNLKIYWELKYGDFVSTLQQAEQAITYPDHLFYDPFSYKTNPSLWTYSTFRILFRTLQQLSPQALKNPHLYTYSHSTAVRSAMLAAGFWVYSGPASGKVSDTTIASFQRNENLNPKLLRADFLKKRQASSHPYLIQDELFQEEIAKRVETHPQFLTG